MKINRESLFVRWLITFTPCDYHTLPQSVCTLFWCLVCAAIMSLGFAFVVALLAFILGMPLLYPFYQWWYSDFTIATLSFFAWLAIGVGYACYLNSEYDFMTKASRFTPVRVVGGFIQAKKHKICPRIEWSNNT